MNRRISAVTLVFIILFSGIFPVRAATNEGYGENQTSLGQFVDSFEDSGNVSVAVNVIQNATLEVMELNYTLGGGTVIYNLTQLREWDVYGAAATPSITFAIQGNDYVNMMSTAASQGDALAFLTMDSSWLDDKYVRFRYYPYSDLVDPAYQTQHFDVYDGTYDRSNNTDFPATVGIPPYNKIPLKGNGILYAYQNIDGLNNWFIKDFQIDTSGGSENNVTLFWWLHDAWGLRTIQMRIDWIEINTGAGGAGNLITINYNNSSPITMELGGTQGDYGFSLNPEIPFSTISGYTSPGYFTTTDYLLDPYASGAGLTVLVNTSIPANTDIQFQISNDNATWRDHEGVIGDSEDLVGGFEAIDLRDLNYSANIYFRGNLSTSDPAATPRFWQIRLITMIGNVSDPIVQNVTGEWVYYNLTEINVSVGVHDGGFVNSTYFIDGDYYNCSEVVGVPGYIVDFNVTGIHEDAVSLWLVSYVFYDGSASHEINVEIYNHTSGAYVEIGEIPDMLGYDWQNFTIYGLRIPNEFVNSTGALIGRFNHLDAGNVNHDISFDRINVLAFIPSAAGPAAEEFQFFWIVLAIALMLIGILLSWLWFEGDR